MLLKNVKIERPRSTKIQAKGGIRYVYQVVGSEYKKDRKYTVDKRVCIGKMIDDSYMIPNDNFVLYYPELAFLDDMPSHSDTLKIGSFLVIRKVMADMKIDALLENVFEKKGRFIEDIVSYMITRESCTFQYYMNFMRNHPSRDGIHDDTQISRLLKSEINEEDIAVFMRAWNALSEKEECIYIGYDSTNFNTCAAGIELADYGHPKVDEGLPQVNLSYTVRQEDSRPLFYELYEGSIIDNVQCSLMVEKAREYGYRDIGFILDRGYCSKRNIGYLRENGYSFIMMMKTGQEICQKIIVKYGGVLKTLEGYYIAEHGLYGMTVEEEIYGEKAYFHLYYNDVGSGEERRSLMEQYDRYEKELVRKLEKKTAVEGELQKYRKAFRLKYDDNGYLMGYARNSRYIKKELGGLGYFMIITSQKMEASEALEIYRGRDNIEKMFRSLKSGIDFSKARVYSTSSLQSKVFITFVAMIVRNEMFQRMEQLRKENRKTYTIPGMISELENIECTKNSRGQYRRKYALSAKQKAILKQFGLDEKEIDKSISKFTY